MSTWLWDVPGQVVGPVPEFKAKSSHVDPAGVSPEPAAQLAAHQFFQAPVDGDDVLAVWPLADPQLRLC